MKFENHSQLPFEVEKTYSTKFQTGEKFVITEIKWRTSKDKNGITTNIKILYFIGYYEKHPHLQGCLLNFDRLIPETTIKPLVLHRKSDGCPFYLEKNGLYQATDEHGTETLYEEDSMEFENNKQTDELASKFVDFDSAHQMKELGFNEKCIGYFENERKNLVVKFDNSELTEQQALRPKLYSYWSTNKELPQWATAAPLWQDAFEWFDMKYGFYPTFKKIDDKGYLYIIDTILKKYEDGSINELNTKKKCLKVLIALASEKK